ncbi:MAG: aminotransferase class V-fold PLP-dependent enzyme [Chromatiales bacterium]|nr:aminotransferase class V-fold PLP-dependent enzyme [Gammaproteobacteria bacterium]
MHPEHHDTLVSLDPSIIYLNHAAVAPWPQKTVKAVERFSRENGAVGAQHYPDWLKTENRLRRQLADLINAPTANDIALLKNTSEALSVIAYGLGWKPGENIVSIAQEFPSNRIVWESLSQLGVELRLLDLDQTQYPENDLIALCDEHTRLISISSVQYASGLKLNLEQVGRFCADNDILFCIDAIQSLGASPFDVEAFRADFVVADGHKWMLGPEGIALFYCRANLRDELKLNQFGWHMVKNAGDFDQVGWTPASSARRFECGSPNMLGIHALHASLEIILETGIESIQQSITANTDAIVAEARRLGFELITPEEKEKRAGIVTFRVPGVDNEGLYQSLMQHGVVCAYRGGGIRFSPHFHNRPEEILNAFSILESQL